MAVKKCTYIWGLSEVLIISINFQPWHKTKWYISVFKIYLEEFCFGKPQQDLENDNISPIL